MERKYIIDTHALIWYLEGNPRLGRKAREIIENPASDMILPIIAVAEATYIIEKRRTSIPTVSDFLTRIQGDPRIEIYPLTFEVFEYILTPEGLCIPELHDRFIVSTGLYFRDLGYTVAILTKDESITDAGVIPVIWK